MSEHCKIKEEGEIRLVVKRLKKLLTSGVREEEEEREHRLAYQKKYYRNNREKMLEYGKNYRDANREKIRLNRRANYEKRGEEIRRKNNERRRAMTPQERTEAYRRTFYSSRMLSIKRANERWLAS